MRYRSGTKIHRNHSALIPHRKAKIKEKLMSKTKVIYHGPHCPDGFGAALAVFLKFGNAAQYIPCDYGGDIPEIEKGDRVYILDFSFKREILEGM
jgi:hypothetical protein